MPAQQGLLIPLDVVEVAVLRDEVMLVLEPDVCGPTFARVVRDGMLRSTIPDRLVLRFPYSSETCILSSLPWGVRIMNVV